jgi:hypothetical protein
MRGSGVRETEGGKTTKTKFRYSRIVPRKKHFRVGWNELDVLGRGVAEKMRRMCSSPPSFP